MVYRHSNDWFLNKGPSMTHKPEPDYRAAMTEKSDPEPDYRSAAMLAYGALLARNGKGEFQPVLDVMREVLFPSHLVRCEPGLRTDLEDPIR